MKIYKCIVALLILSTIGCEDEKITENYEINPIASRTANSGELAGLNVQNGRLIFENNRDLKNVLDFLTHSQLSKTELFEYFNNYYASGFSPLFPLFVDDERTANQLTLRNQYTPSDKIDVENIELSDVLVTFDEFAMLLNHKREIVIGNHLYVYTYSRLYRTELENENILFNFLIENESFNIAPSIMDLTPGITSPEPDIEVYVSPNIFIQEEENCFNNSTPGETPDPLASSSPINNLLYPEICDHDPNYDFGGGIPSSSSTNSEHDMSKAQYSLDITPCVSDEVWNPFGTIKVCYDYFTGGVRRTKTKYEHIDLGTPWVDIQSYTVKVKHQRKHSVLFVEWWAYKETHEIALDINQATFVINPNNIDYSLTDVNFPSNQGTNNLLFHIGNSAYTYNPSDPIIVLPQQHTLPNLTPHTPFNEDVVVQVFNCAVDFVNNIPLVNVSQIDVDEVNEFYWDQIHEQTKNLFQQISGYEPRKITTILHTRDRIIVNYVDISRRRLNDHKITDNLFFEVGVEFKVTVSVDEWNSLITNPAVLESDVEETNNPDIFSFSVERQNLTEFDQVVIDFNGFTRRGDEWRGSKLREF